MDDFPAMIAAVVTSPDDRTIQMALADWLDERDLEPEWARRLRAGEAVRAVLYNRRDTRWRWERTITVDVPTRGGLRTLLLHCFPEEELCFLRCEQGISRKELLVARCRPPRIAAVVDAMEAPRRAARERFELEQRQRTEEAARQSREAAHQAFLARLPSLPMRDLLVLRQQGDITAEQYQAAMTDEKRAAERVRRELVKNQPKSDPVIGGKPLYYRWADVPTGLASMSKWQRAGTPVKDESLEVAWFQGQYLTYPLYSAAETVDPEAAAKKSNRLRAI